jgi:starch phosphorylase
MRASILNIARMAWFSSDRTISEYAADVWDVPVSNPADAVVRKAPHA